jgi:hypothetical protein
MMNKDLIFVIEQIGREKGIGKEVLFEALESALLSASKKTMGAADNVRMQIDRQTGTLRVFARKKVVAAVTDPRPGGSTPRCRWTTRSSRSWPRRSSGASRRRPPSR